MKAYHCLPTPRMNVSRHLPALRGVAGASPQGRGERPPARRTPFRARKNVCRMPAAGYLLPVLFCLLILPPSGFAVEPPTGLTTDLLEHTDRVFLDGYPANIQLDELNTAIERFQTAAIRSSNPWFGWIVNDSKPDILQTAFRILVVGSRESLAQNRGDMWDSGRTESDNSTAVRYAGKALQPSTVYYWKVQTWNSLGEESPFSEPRGFITASVFDGRTSCYPLQVTDEYPARIRNLPAPGIIFIDFGKAAFGRLRITLSSPCSDTVTVHLGEHARNGRVDRKPGATVRYAAYKLPLTAGTHTYTVKIRPDRRNTSVTANESGVSAILMPAYTGEVMPFRYCEIEGYGGGTLRAGDAVRQSVHYPFNDKASHFLSSDTVLNQVWANSLPPI